MFVNDAFILTNLELPTSFTANNLTPPETYDASNEAPVDNVGLELVNTNSPKLVPIPSVITDDVETTKDAGEEIFDCEFVTLNAVVPE